MPGILTPGMTRTHKPAATEYKYTAGLSHSAILPRGE